MKRFGWLFFIAIVGYSLGQISLSVTASTATKQWIRTEATVVDTRTKFRKKHTYSYAQVSYTAQDEKLYETEVKVLAVPFIGTSLKPNETLTIIYDADNPIIAKTPALNFIERYGLLILIGVGILFVCLHFLRLYFINLRSKPQDIS